MPKPKIYDQHDKAFAHVSAFCILHSGERCASIAFKYPRDGAGRLYAYVHWFGVPMVRGHAGGYGYDKRSAACSSAAGHILAEESPYATPERIALQKLFIEAIAKDDGMYWNDRLAKIGFDVFQAV